MNNYFCNQLKYNGNNIQKPIPDCLFGLTGTISTRLTERLLPYGKLMNILNTIFSPNYNKYIYNTYVQLRPLFFIKKHKKPYLITTNPKFNKIGTCKFGSIIIGKKSLINLSSNISKPIFILK